MEDCSAHPGQPKALTSAGSRRTVVAVWLTALAPASHPTRTISSLCDLRVLEHFVPDLDVRFQGLKKVDATKMHSYQTETGMPTLLPRSS